MKRETFGSAGKGVDIRNNPRPSSTSSTSTVSSASASASALSSSLSKSMAFWRTSDCFFVFVFGTCFLLYFPIPFSVSFHMHALILIRTIHYFTLITTTHILFLYIFLSPSLSLLSIYHRHKVTCLLIHSFPLQSSSFPPFSRSHTCMLRSSQPSSLAFSDLLSNPSFFSRLCNIICFSPSTVMLLRPT